MTTVITAPRIPCQDLPDSEHLFGNALQQRRVRHVCAPCPIRVDCLARALTERADIGLWGGLTHAERQALRRRHPQVSDWFAFLARNPAVPVGKDNRT
ncbi:WhiB family transcriptional regulator [Nocardiopsis quinghaiensis]|uniref:WhiB family transcriptional regulator n=1 Tax=Nocardiopsis quinghaiensis TaxID=464995 RepID=UPI00123B1F55|nr:WhiB family transcriptional regulator [Nocardiopsis quinghaiensis]